MQLVRKRVRVLIVNYVLVVHSTVITFSLLHFYYCISWYIEGNIFQDPASRIFVSVLLYILIYVVSMHNAQETIDLRFNNCGLSLSFL